MGLTLRDEKVQNEGHDLIRQAINTIKETYNHNVSVDAKRKSLLKFGKNENVGTSDVMVEPSGTETYVSDNTIAYFSSSSGSDTGSMVVEYHTVDGNGDFTFGTQTVTLAGQTKTAVISKAGMNEVLGFSTGSNQFLKFLKGSKIAPHVSAELNEKLEKPIIFQGITSGANTPPPVVHGYDVTVLIDICKAIITADTNGNLLDRQRNIVKQAHIIIGASAKAGIKGLAYALAGYDATREEIISAFRAFIIEEAREYEKEFSDLLYKEWYRLYELPEPVKNKPWKFKHLTVEQVYWPLAKSNGKILEMTRIQKATSGDRQKKLHQFLSEVGVKALRQHLGQLLGIAQISENKEEYEKNVRKVFGDQHELDV